MSFHTHEHNHAHAHSTNTRILRVSLAVIAGFMLVEAAAGWLSGSLALLSDAGHMFSDAASLALALFAFKWAEKAANSQKSYGYQRVEILAAALNGLGAPVPPRWLVSQDAIVVAHPDAVVAIDPADGATAWRVDGAVTSWFASGDTVVVFNGSTMSLLSFDSGSEPAGPLVRPLT